MAPVDALKTLLQRRHPRIEAALRTSGVQFLLFPLSILWLEIVFKASTTGGFWPALHYIIPFSFIGGTFALIASSLTSNQKVNRAIRLVILTVLGVVYGIEYFVFCEFKMFYSLSTVTNAAGHAASGFSDQIAILVFNPSGLTHVVLFLFPALLYSLLLMKEDPARQMPFSRAITAAICALAAHFIVVTLIGCAGTYGLAYTSRYSFESCVTNFGFLTSLRKEIWHSMAGSQATSFSSPDETHAATTQATQSGAKDNPDKKSDKDADKTKGKSSTKKDAAKPNVLDIDFAALAKTTDGEWQALDNYVASQTPSLRNDMTGLFKGYNLIFISAEAFSAEAIREDTTPTLYRMATKGIQFTDYYQPASAGTTGGEYLNLFGLIPTDGGSSFTDTETHNNYLTMGNTLNRLGYEGWAFHNNDYTYYDRNITHVKLGYNNGFIGMGNGMEQWVSDQWPESDLEMVQGTWENLYGSLGDAKHPFNIYYMSVSGHGLYTTDINAMSEKWWDEVADLPYSDPVKAYLACNIDLDRAMEYLIKQLEKRGIAKRTVIVISADHFPYGLDDDSLADLPVLSELYGHEVSNLLDRDHNRLIIWSGSLEKRRKPLVVDTPTSSLDILPTLLNLFGAEWDSRLLPGRDVFSDRSPLVFDLNYDWKTDLGTYIADEDAFTPVEGKKIPDGYVESMNAVVSDKLNYCAAVLDTDYFRHVFGDPEDAQAVNKAAKKESGSTQENAPWGSDIIERFKEKHNYT
ncbi:MAG: sulfatase-like hydrolase/transferase [Atopobiaceae bacterium]|nr:sulfatase-like hydrolase/transferase [Atopobiaceae bacterium]